MTVIELQSYIQKNIDKLPPEKLEQLKETIDKMVEQINEGKKTTLEKRKFGSMKGFVKYMAPDFDEPLEDFKDYM